MVICAICGEITFLLMREVFTTEDTKGFYLCENFNHKEHKGFYPLMQLLICGNLCHLRWNNLCLLMQAFFTTTDTKVFIHLWRCSFWFMQFAVEKGIARNYLQTEPIKKSRWASGLSKTIEITLHCTCVKRVFHD